MLYNHRYMCVGCLQTYGRPLQEAIRSCTLPGVPAQHAPHLRPTCCAMEPHRVTSCITPAAAGMAGLSCARHLHRAGVSFSLLEAADAVGGRVRTDAVEGFLLDRGFQIFLTSYAEARDALDYPALDLRPFYAGARRELPGAACVLRGRRLAGTLRCTACSNNTPGTLSLSELATDMQSSSGP